MTSIVQRNWYKVISPKDRIHYWEHFFDLGRDEGKKANESMFHVVNVTRDKVDRIY